MLVITSHLNDYSQCVDGLGSTYNELLVGVNVTVCNDIIIINTGVIGVIMSMTMLKYCLIVTII